MSTVANLDTQRTLVGIYMVVLKSFKVVLSEVLVLEGVEVRDLSMVVDQMQIQ